MEPKRQQQGGPVVSLCFQQVRWDDQSQYHQESDVFVGGRLSFLLPPAAEIVLKPKSRTPRDGGGHTQTADFRRSRQGGSFCLSKSVCALMCRLVRWSAAAAAAVEGCVRGKG